MAARLFGFSIEDSERTPPGVVSPVPVWLWDWSHNNVLILILWEPWLKNIEIFLCFISPRWKPFFHIMLRETKTNEVIILNVFRGLEVSNSSLSIIEGVLYWRKKLIQNLLRIVSNRIQESTRLSFEFFIVFGYLILTYSSWVVKPVGL